MSSKSNNQGRAYEFAFLNILYKKISEVRCAEIEKNSSYFAAEKAWETLTKLDKETYKISALSGIETIFELEPLILDDCNDSVLLKIQADDKGKDGDVRDILIIRENIQWEIGLSIKHNHFAVKHSRLSKNLDFGEKWYGIKCSVQYWKDVKPIFNYLENKKQAGVYWREIINKADKVYVPLLNAFKNEIIRQNESYKNKIPELIVEYLLGKFDFYKVIGIDRERNTQIQSYNLRGTLNKQGKVVKRRMEIPISKLPTRIIYLDFKPNSKNTLELYLDNGWQFSFRIHNASSKVEPSLKFDIQLIGMPATIITIDCKWDQIIYN